MTTTLTLRSVKGSPLTNTEMDANFTALRTTVDATAIVANAAAAAAQAALTNASSVTSFNSRTGPISLTSGDVTAALSYTPVSPTGLTSALTSYATLASPHFTGTPSLPGGTTGFTQNPGTNNTSLSTTGFTTAAVAVETSRATTAEALLAPKASPTLTGTPLAPTATTGTNTAQIATCAFVAATVVAATAGVATFNTRSGAVTLSSADVTTALSFTPYNVSNPAGYQDAAGVAAIAHAGVTTNSNATAGQIGEYIKSTIAVGSAVNLAANTPTNVTSISLTAGDWDVWGSVADNPAASTIPTILIGAISTTTNTLGTSPGEGAWASFPVQRPAGFGTTLPIGRTRLSLAATTTVYLVIQASFTTSTCGGYGFIGARRVR